jgi:hypothetical protein
MLSAVRAIAERSRTVNGRVERRSLNATMPPFRTCCWRDKPDRKLTGAWLFNSVHSRFNASSSITQ